MLMFYDKDQSNGYSYSDDVELRYDINQILIQIDEDRYNGAYSDHSYTAWCGVRPEGISDPDPTCEEFWSQWKDKAVYGGGETPQEAYLDLIEKMNDLGLMTEDDGHCRGPLLVVTLHQWGTPDVGFVYRSDEFRQWIKERTIKVRKY